MSALVYAWWLSNDVADKGLSYVGKMITIGGWTRTIRKQVGFVYYCDGQGGGKFAFVVMNDGSAFDNLQCVSLYLSVSLTCSG